MGNFQSPEEKYTQEIHEQLANRLKEIYEDVKEFCESRGIFINVFDVCSMTKFDAYYDNDQIKLLCHRHSGSRMCQYKYDFDETLPNLYCEQCVKDQKTLIESLRN